MIVLFTDFGLQGPYCGQMKAVLHAAAPGLPVIDLFSDLAPFNARAAAYLLPAYAGEFPAGSVFLCVVDPGVGGDRAAVIVEAGGYRFVGPDNGLFAMLARRFPDAAWSRISWRPELLSASFHGRDLFAPVVARLANGQPVETEPYPAPLLFPDWPDDLPEIVYVDHYGNAVTGLRAGEIAGDAVLTVEGRKLMPARTFSDAKEGEAFWYGNANGLVEIAVNRGSAAELLGLGSTLR